MFGIPVARYLVHLVNCLLRPDHQPNRPPSRRSTSTEL